MSIFVNMRPTVEFFLYFSIFPSRPRVNRSCFSKSFLPLRECTVAICLHAASSPRKTESDGRSDRCNMGTLVGTILIGLSSPSVGVHFSSQDLVFPTFASAASLSPASEWRSLFRVRRPVNISSSRANNPALRRQSSNFSVAIASTCVVSTSRAGSFSM